MNVTAKPEKDRFSAVASTYARFRPVYPPALYDAVLQHVPVRDLALDCGAGNGQAAAALAQRFKTVYATDISAEQLKNAAQAPNIRYVQSPGHVCPPGIADDTLDLITAAQAAHWFAPQAFVDMARQKLRPGGVIAIWGYSFFRSENEKLDRAIMEFGLGPTMLGPYWDPEVLMIGEEYKNYPWPFQPLPAPDIRLEVRWTLAEALGYFQSWSAAKKFIDAKGIDAFYSAAQIVTDAWTKPDVPRSLFVKIALRMGKNPNKIN